MCVAVDAGKDVAVWNNGFAVVAVVSDGVDGDSSPVAVEVAKVTVKCNVRLAMEYDVHDDYELYSGLSHLWLFYMDLSTRNDDPLNFVSQMLEFHNHFHQINIRRVTMDCPLVLVLYIDEIG